MEEEDGSEEGERRNRKGRGGEVRERGYVEEWEGDGMWGVGGGRENVGRSGREGEGMWGGVGGRGRGCGEKWEIQISIYPPLHPFMCLHSHDLWPLRWRHVCL